MTPSPISEIHLRRLPVDEALYRLEQFLSDAFMAGLPTVRVVHGKGSGLVRAAVRERLGEHPLVRGHQFASPAEGDTGVTIVHMEQPPLPPRSYLRDRGRSTLRYTWRGPTP